MGTYLGAEHLANEPLVSQTCLRVLHGAVQLKMIG